MQARDSGRSELRHRGAGFMVCLSQVHVALRLRVAAFSLRG